MVEITDEMVMRGALAALNAVREQKGLPPLAEMPADFWDGEQWSLEARAAITAVAPLIAAVERAHLVRVLDALVSQVEEGKTEGRFKDDYFDGAATLAEILARAIRARGGQP